MSASSISDVSDLLRTLPEMEPPANAWSRLRSSQRRALVPGSPRVWSGVAAAACAALVAFGLLFVGEEPAAPTLLSRVAVPASPGAAVAEPGAGLLRAADLDQLRRQSRQLERRLAGLPQRRQVVQADVAGMIAELQEQIAAVDYELNRQGSTSISSARWPSAAPAAIYATDRASGYGSDELWGQRVRLMQRLVSVRFAEAGAAAY